MKNRSIYIRRAYRIIGTLFFLFNTSFIPFTAQRKIVLPTIITQKVFADSDDPAIWINYANPAASLILGTDKDDFNGGVYVFDLLGRIDSSRTQVGLKRMNNIDVIQNVTWNKGSIDLVVATERGENQLRIYELPSMRPLDGGGIPVFIGEKDRDPMGVALYKRKSDGALFVIVGRKSGPSGTYLWQYRLSPDKKGNIQATVVRKFGKFSGFKEIESIAVDTLFEHIYYSDEQIGVRKYYADPRKGDQELALIGKSRFKEDNEGISFYHLSDSTGYILVSDQGANQFQVFQLEGSSTNPHEHKHVGTIPVSAQESDGSDCTAFPLPGFKKGLFVAMSTDRTFHYYNWEEFEKMITDSSKLYP
jgi:3-phytase